MSLQDYELKLSAKAKIHPMFNICNLKKHHESIFHIAESESNIIENIEEYQVESIEEKKQTKQDIQYLVKWIRYSKTTWKSRKNLINTKNILCTWEIKKIYNLRRWSNQTIEIESNRYHNKQFQEDNKDKDMKDKEQNDHRLMYIKSYQQQKGSRKEE